MLLIGLREEGGGGFRGECVKYILEFWMVRLFLLVVVGV